MGMIMTDINWRNLYGKDFEIFIKKCLEKSGFKVVHSIYVELPEDDYEAQIDLAAFDFPHNTAYIIEVKSWDAVEWMSFGQYRKNWVSVSPNNIMRNRFNPMMQCSYANRTLETALARDFGIYFNYYLNERVVMKYTFPFPQWGTSVSTGLQLPVGIPSKENIQNIYNWCLYHSDPSEEREKIHIERLKRFKENRTGAYGFDWDSYINELLGNDSK